MLLLPPALLLLLLGGLVPRLEPTYGLLYGLTL
jgi:hypothetical protein